MSKRRKVDFASPDKLQSCLKDDTVIDWSKCFICQEDAKEKLQCSFNATKIDEDKINSNYTDLTERMLAFQKEGFMPISVNFGALHEGYDTLELSLFNNKASYHKNCRSMFNSRQMERMKAKSVSVDTQPTQDRTPVQSRVEGSRHLTPEVQEEAVCYFCNKPKDEKSSLHLVHSFRLDQRVRRCAKLLDDTYLYAKLQQGDMIAQDAQYHRKCILELYRNASKRKLEGCYTDDQRQLQGIAFSEII